MPYVYLFITSNKILAYTTWHWKNQLNRIINQMSKRGAVLELASLGYKIHFKVHTLR